MEYIIAGLLFANIAVCLFKKGPLGINFTLTIKQEAPITTSVEEDPKEDDLYKNMQGLLGALNEYIEKGGEVDEG